MERTVEDIEILVWFEAFDAAMLAYGDRAHAQEIGRREAAAFKAWADRGLIGSRGLTSANSGVDWRRVTMHALSSIIVTPPVS
ncbi:hypothetical protein [Dyella sp. GSA-30]|uniref:hypothetical protein n=1 Tax=Dyella sp. GSA-30 TaxID=2994496 RepID=UPI0024938C8E|nr:hypothetical protein [Dyella sp. GSA-30]BDU22934.1 hypothetical protein DYGSA30_43910 [Dyella sp. GSA-30]